MPLRQIAVPPPGIPLQKQKTAFLAVDGRSCGDEGTIPGPVYLRPPLSSLCFALAQPLAPVLRDVSSVLLPPVSTRPSTRSSLGPHPGLRPVCPRSPADAYGACAPMLYFPLFTFRCVAGDDGAALREDIAVRLPRARRLAGKDTPCAQHPLRLPFVLSASCAQCAPAHPPLACAMPLAPAAQCLVRSVSYVCGHLSLGTAPGVSSGLAGNRLNNQARLARAPCSWKSVPSCRQATPCDGISHRVDLW